MNLVGVQLDIAWEDKQANFTRVKALLENEKIPAGSLIVLPEMFSTGFSLNVEGVVDGPERESEMFLSQLAEEQKCFVAGGIATRAAEGRGCNESVVYNPQGFEIVRYCKLHPFSFADEHLHYLPGNCIQSFEWHDFMAAPLICYDLRFPEAFRRALDIGANLFMVIANWPLARQQHWEALLLARAIENQAYVIGVNRCGADPKQPYGGGSRIIDPTGQILALADASESVIQATPDWKLLCQYRASFPALSDRRRDYSQLATGGV